MAVSWPCRAPCMAVSWPCVATQRLASCPLLVTIHILYRDLASASCYIAAHTLLSQYHTLYCDAIHQPVIPHFCHDTMLCIVIYSSSQATRARAVVRVAPTLGCIAAFLSAVSWLSIVVSWLSLHGPAPPCVTI